MDGTGTLLLFAGLGMLPGLMFGLIGKPSLLWAGILAGLALVVWQMRQAQQDTEWYAVLNVIIIAATVWAILVMAITYIIVKRLRLANVPSEARPEQ
jgi:heme/copper-type cytochrome/quinol oxidase subunit 2